MTRRPFVTCLMVSSIDGRLHPSCYTDSPDGAVEDWDSVYSRLHDALAADAWLIGTVTMAEMAKGEARTLADAATPPRPVFKAPGCTKPYAVAPDARGRLHFAKPDIGGDHVIVVLGSDIGDAHLAGLIDRGVSYIVADDERPDLAMMLASLKAEFGVERLALEGGGGINGAMIAAGLVDELHVLVAPALDGDDARQGIVIAPDGGLKGRAQLSMIGCEQHEHGTVLLRYRVRSQADAQA